MLFGSHLSIAGGMENALLSAQELNMDCVQVFTKNQRQWRVPALTESQVERWREAMSTTGIFHTTSHDSYLINLASPKEQTREKSIALFREELRRCDRLGIPHLVAHPGAHTGSGEEAGLKRIVEALDRLHDQMPALTVVTCLEITAGQGTTLGYRLEHLATVIDRVQASERLAVCLDTAHLLGAGYDLTSAAGARGVLDQVDATVGLDRVRVLHLNDSKVALNSRKDRHEHIGHGYVAMEAFREIVNEPAFRRVPSILETPKDRNHEGRRWDEVNLESLRGLKKNIAPDAGEGEEHSRPGMPHREA